MGRTGAQAARAAASAGRAWARERIGGMCGAADAPRNPARGEATSRLAPRAVSWDMDIAITHDEARRRFVADLGGQTAELTYIERDAQTVVFNHTFVPPGMRGGGVAAALAARALGWARDSGRKVIPVCPYVASYMQRHPEYEDLLAR